MLACRAHLNIETSTPPDSGNTDPSQVDKANRVGIYVGVGAGSRRLQSYLGVDGSGVSYRKLTLDTVNTGSALAPASNTFVGGQTSTGKLVSGATASGQPLLEISGSGTIKASTYNGQVLEDTGWITVSLQSGWGHYDTVNAYGPVQYRRKNGVVYMKGLAVVQSGGNSAAAIFYLPAGYRPTTDTLLAVAGGSGVLYVEKGGRVFAPGWTGGGAGSFISLGTSFPADQ